MIRSLCILTALITFALGVWSGFRWQAYLYEDSCLDLGGGKNPGGYPICVIVKTAKPPEK